MKVTANIEVFSKNTAKGNMEYHRVKIKGLKHDSIMIRIYLKTCNWKLIKLDLLLKQFLR